MILPLKSWLFEWSPFPQMLLRLMNHCGFGLPQSTLNSLALTPLVPNPLSIPGSPIAPTSFAKISSYSHLASEGYGSNFPQVQMKLSRTLWGPPRYKSISVSPVSCLEEKGFNLLGLPWVPNGRFKQSIIKEVWECRNRGKAVKKQSYSNGQGPGSSLGDVHNNLIHNFCRTWGPHPGGGW